MAHSRCAGGAVVAGALSAAIDRRESDLHRCRWECRRRGRRAPPARCPPDPADRRRRCRRDGHAAGRWDRWSPPAGRGPHRPRPAIEMEGPGHHPRHGAGGLTSGGDAGHGEVHRSNRTSSHLTEAPAGWQPPNTTQARKSQQPFSATRTRPKPTNQCASCTSAQPLRVRQGGGAKITAIA
jgi:hypothetical protein